MYFQRHFEHRIHAALRQFPVVAMIGPRQCGKSTTSREVLKVMPGALHLDLERPGDLAKLRDAEGFLSLHGDRLVCLDEIHHRPDLFPVLRVLADEGGRNGRFLVLGSASPELLRQGAESLAGRLAVVPCTPFLPGEVDDLHRLWLRGGYPRSYLAEDDAASLLWREQFVATVLERDLPGLGSRIEPAQLRRFFTLCAHANAQVLNCSRLGGVLGVSHHTIQSYVALFGRTHLLRVLPPLEANLKKRLVKSPKVFVRDTGLLHHLLGIGALDDLYAHPGFGSSWESLGLEAVLGGLAGWEASFYRSATGDEIDLVLSRGGRRVGIEFKASRSPALEKGGVRAVRDLGLGETWIVAPVPEPYQAGDGLFVGRPEDAIRRLREPAP